MEPMQIVNDISGLNPVRIAHILTPTSIDEIIQAVKEHSGSISIGGGYFSMGGQIASENSLHIDMRYLKNIVEYHPDKKEIVVEAGIRWRDIQEYIDEDDLSVKIMQTYCNFTVGGSLSVNAHGRYVRQGPIILSVKAIKLVLADGELITASRNENSDIFFGAIGGYGGLGIIVEVTLELAPNVKIAREQIKLNVENYRQFFFDNVRDNEKAVFHNADLYPWHYKQARAITWVETDKPLTSEKRVASAKKSYAIERYFVWAITSTPFGKWRREYIYDPLIYLFHPVVWRNTEASCYDVNELEPRSREKITYVLQEYFIPVMQFDSFLQKMTEILQRYKVNMLNISVRHAKQDSGSLLAWAKEEVFAFVLYYKQQVTPAAQTKVGIWTRELINAAISEGGSYYLPYQLHATAEQFHQAYPRLPEFFALKKKLDPDYKFRNKLWDKYYFQNADKLESSEFQAIYSNELWRDRFYLFLQNIYNIFPEDDFHILIQNMSETYHTDQDIYENIQKKLPDIKPVLAELRYAVPALIKQKKEIVRQTLMLLKDKKEIDGFVEIGSTGRYISELRKHVLVKEPVYLVHDQAPSYSPADLAERGQITKLGHFVALDDYDPIRQQAIPDASVDLITCYVGLHHAPLEKLEKFVLSIHRILRPGALFIVRDHDVNTPEIRTFVSLVHTVFNAGLGVSWEDNCKELRHFTAVDDLVSYLEERGFKSTGMKLLQMNDPSNNTLMAFIKVQE